MEKSRTVYAMATEAKATAELVIKDFVGVVNSSKPGKFYFSDIFMVGDTPMAIVVYPNGYREKYNGNVSILLDNKSDADITVKYKLETNGKDMFLSMEPREPEKVLPAKKGVLHLLSHAKFTDADADFVLTANVEILGKDLRIMGNEDVVVPKKFDFRESLYSKMVDPNFKLVFQGVEVPCHKHVLAAASPVFEAMVQNQHLEAIQSKANIELTEEMGRAFVKYLYTGKLEEGILREEALAFLELGNMYDVQELKDLAEAELLVQLDKKNMVHFLSIGDTFNATKIFEAAMKMTKANMTLLRSQVCNVFQKSAKRID